MRVFLCELRKLFTSGFFIFISVTAIVLNIYLCVTSKPAEVSDEYYKSFYNTLDGLSEQDKKETINFEFQKICENLIANDYEFEDLQKREFVWTETQRAELIWNYRNYLAEIDNSAERMTSVSIFADKNSFAYKNIVATPPAYNAVREVVPRYTRSEGVLLAIKNPGCDIMLIFCALTSVIALIVKERESGITALIKPLPGGRAKLAAAKSFAVLFCVILMGIVLYGSALISGAARFGLGDLSLPVQSLNGFLGCNLPINIGTAITVIFFIKIAAAFLAALIFECLCTKFYSIYAYLITAAVAGAEIFLYNTISAESPFSLLGKVNIAAFSDCARLLENYVKIPTCTVLLLRMDKSCNSVKLVTKTEQFGILKNQIQ